MMGVRSGRAGREAGRRSAVLALVVALVLAGPASGPVAAAESDGSYRICLRVAGAEPSGGWDAESLRDAITSGAAVVVLVTAPATCQEYQPVVIDDDAAEATPEPLERVDAAAYSEPIVAGDPGDPVDAVEPVDTVDSGDPDGAATDGRAPVRIDEVGFTRGKDGPGTFAAVITNPNASDWTAWFLAVEVRVLDEDGDVIETVPSGVSLLPGQTTAITGAIAQGRAPASVEVVVEEGDIGWKRDRSAGDGVRFARVRTKKSDIFGAVTTGRIRNTSAADLENVQVVLVYRDRKGAILGGDFTFVASVPAGEAVPFEVTHLGELTHKRIADTEAYYRLTLDP